ncbi:hypothetical protein [Cloacibacillus porcorum]
MTIFFMGKYFYRLLIILITVLVSVAPSLAEQFDGFNGVKWGTTYEEAPFSYAKSTDRHDTFYGIFFVTQSLPNTVAGLNVGSIEYVFDTKTKKLTGCVFGVNFRNDVKTFEVDKNVHGIGHTITYPTAQKAVFLDKLCAYFSKNYGKYKKIIENQQVTRYLWKTQHNKVLMTLRGFNVTEPSAETLACDFIEVYIQQQ